MDDFVMVESTGPLSLSVPYVVVHTPDDSLCAVPRAVVESEPSSVLPPVGTDAPLVLTCGSCAAAQFVTMRYLRNPPHCVEGLRHDPKLMIAVLEVSHALHYNSLMREVSALLGSTVRAILSECIARPHASSLKEGIVALRAAVGEKESQPFDKSLESVIEIFQPNLSVSCDGTVGAGSAADVHLKTFAMLQKPVWEADDVRDHCYRCGTAFSYRMMSLFGAGVFRSHCRHCGRLMCGNCVKFPIAPRDVLASDPTLHPVLEGAKACAVCFDIVVRRTRLDALSASFVRGGLSVVEISLLRVVSESWSVAAESVLRVYHDSFYRFVAEDEPLTPLMMQLCRNSLDLFVDHRPLIVFAFWSIDWMNESDVGRAMAALRQTTDVLRGKPPTCRIWQHSQLLCSRWCNVMPHAIFGVMMLNALVRAPRTHSAVSEALKLIHVYVCQKETPTHVRRLVVPFLLDLLQRSAANDPIAVAACSMVRYLMDGEESVATQVLFEISSRPATPLLQTVHRQFFDRQRSSMDLSRTLAVMRVIHDAAQQAMTKGLDDAALQRLLFDGLRRANMTSAPIRATLPAVLDIHPIRWPFKPSHRIVAIALNDVTVKGSAVRPIVVPFIAQGGETLSMLFKCEDLRRDYMATLFIEFVYQVLGDARVKAMPSYRVLPFSAKSGAIEMVPCCETLRSLRRRYPTLASALEAECGGGEAKAQFVRSAELSVVLSYVLGLGDRHLDNILLHRRTGALFHIDFGFLLNLRPTVEQLSPYFFVRLDLDILDAVARCYDDAKGGGKGWGDGGGRGGERGGGGGSFSDAVKTFHLQAAQLFLALRPYTPMMAMMVSHFATHKSIEQTNAAMQAILTRLMMSGVNDRHARDEFTRRVDGSRGSEWLRDWIHDVSMTWKARLGW